MRRRIVVHTPRGTYMSKIDAIPDQDVYQLVNVIAEGPAHVTFEGEAGTKIIIPGDLLRKSVVVIQNVGE